jgi:predicted RNase H-like nuclease
MEKEEVHPRACFLNSFSLQKKSRKKYDNPFRSAKSAKTKSCAKNCFNNFFALMEKEEVHPRAFHLIFYFCREEEGFREDS